MNDNRSKQILDSTFQYLEEAIEEVQRKKASMQKENVKIAEQKVSEDSQNDSD